MALLGKFLVVRDMTFFSLLGKPSFETRDFLGNFWALIKEPVDEQNAVEMVDFVLDDPGQKALDFEIDFLSVHGVRVDLDGFVAFDQTVETGQRQAAFLGFDRAGCLLDHRVEENEFLARLFFASRIGDKESQR